MEGSWRVYDRGQRWSKAGHLARVVLDAGDQVARRLPARRRRAGPARARGRRSSATSAPTCSAPTGTSDEAVRRLTRRPDRAARRGAARPAQPRRHRHDLPHRAVLPHRLRPAYAGRRGHRPAADGAAGPPAARPEPAPAPDLHHRRQAPRAAACGSTAGRASGACAAARPIAYAELGEPGRERAAYWCPSCQPAAVTKRSGGGGDDLAAARARIGSSEVSAAAASSIATASETSRSTSESGTSRAAHSEASSSEEASFWPRSISEM